MNESKPDDTGNTGIPTVEILDETPVTMRRPVALIGDHAYGAIWPFVKTSRPMITDDESNASDRESSKVTRRLCIVRSDGTVFGAGKYSLSDLKFDVALKEKPPDDKLWSPRSAKAFGKAELVDPCEVFRQVVDVINRFIDFDRSLADQQLMSELVACSILSTWFLEAFNVIGFLWPTGESGSGKTQLLTIISELGYLGVLILAGGSYASLRDLADYGATLCFDDAENLDAKRADPDKRTLLLAGNRRGNMVTVKEPTGERGWETRYINTFCLRGFSAITLPDRILASRSILFPLVRTSDSHRADADPADYSLWPHDRRSLVDSLWSMALANLADLRGYERRVKLEARLSGRNLEPWQASLAIAAWLQQKGVERLYERLESLSVKYQSERLKINSADLVVVVIRALCHCLNCDVVTLCDPCDVTHESISDTKTLILTDRISTVAKDIADEDEIDLESNKLESRQIGSLMRKLRFEHGSEGGTHKKGWRVSKRELCKLALAYGLVNRNHDPVIDSHYSNVTNVTEGHNVTKEAPMHVAESDCFDDANALAWQAQTGF